MPTCSNPRRDEVPEALRLIEEFAGERVPKFVEDARELLLQVAREDRVRDGPRNDRELLRPRARRLGARELPLEGDKGVANPVAPTVQRPARRLILEGLPVLAPRIAVADLRRINDPNELVVACGRRDLDVGAQRVLQR